MVSESGDIDSHSSIGRGSTGGDTISLMAPSRRIGQLGGDIRHVSSAVGAVPLSHDYLFQKIPPIRAFARRIVSNVLFETVVLVSILCNVIAMALEDVPARRSGVSNHTNDVVTLVDRLTIAVFTLEFVFRVLAFGLVPLPSWCPSLLRPDAHITIQKTDISKVVPEPANFVDAMQAAMDAQALVDTADLEKAQGRYYFKSNWNKLDFLVLVIGLLNVFVESNKTLSSLRSLRALRPLRMVQFIAPLQVILKSIWRAVGTLVDVFICLCFMYLLFALFGQQMYQGSLRRRCVAPAGLDALRFNTSAPEHGHLMALIRHSGTDGPTNYTVFQPETFCSYAAPGCDGLGVTAVDVDAGNGLQSVTVPFVCANINENPRYGKVSFDNLGSSLWTVFMMTSLEGWTDVMYALMDAEVNAVAAIFSVSIIVVIAFLGIQLFTSALCTSSMQVRAEEAMNRRREVAIARAQKKLWQERQRLKRNVQIVATVWRQNVRMRALRRLGIESSVGDSEYPHHMMSDASLMCSGVVRTIVEGSPLGSCRRSVGKAAPGSGVHHLGTTPSIRAVPLEPKTTLAGFALDGSTRMSKLIELPDTTRPAHRNTNDLDDVDDDGSEAASVGPAEAVEGNQVTRQRSGSLPPRFPSTSTSPQADSPAQSDEESETISGGLNLPVAAACTPETLVEPISAIPRALLDELPVKRLRPLLAPLDARRTALDSPLRTMSHVTIPKLNLTPAPTVPASLTPQNLTTHRSSAEPGSARYKTPRMDADVHATARSGIGTAHREVGSALGTARGRQTHRGLRIDPTLTQRSKDQRSARSAATGTSGTPRQKPKRTLAGILTAASTRIRGTSEPPSLRSAAPMLKKLVKRGGLQRTTRMAKFSSRGLSRFKSTGSKGLSINSFFERSNQSLTTPGSARRPSMDAGAQARALFFTFTHWKPVAAVGHWIDGLADAIDPLCGRCSRLLEQPWFDRAIVGCIIVNAIGIASFYHNLSKPHEMALQVSEFVFAWIFTFEMLIKFFGLRGLKNYFSTKQNIFDFIVVMTSLPSVIIPLSAGSFSAKNKLAAVSSLRLFRLFRVFRIARLLHKLKSMRKLLTSVLESITAIANLLFFILFALVTLSIATTNLFSRQQAPAGIDPSSDFDAHGYNVYAHGHSPRYHYDSFFDSFLSLFIIMTGENWTDWYYYSILTASPIVAAIFQLFYFILSNYVLLSLFIAVIIRNFDAKEEERDRQQRTAYERLNELIRHKATIKVQRRRSSVTKVAKDLAKSFRIPKLRRTSAVAPEPLQEAFYGARSESVTVASVSDAPVINLAQARQPFTQPPLAQQPQLPQAAPPSVRTTSRPPVFLAMLRNVTTSVRDSVAKLVNHVEGVSDALLTDEHVLDEARKLGAAMDTTAANKEDHPRMEGVSLGRFSRKSPFRILCYFLVTHRYFEWLIMGCIMASGVMLAIEAGKESGGQVNASDMVFNAVFLVELLLKVVAFGWYRTGRFAYLKSSWNIADLVILAGSITASLVDIFSAGSSVKFLRVFRLGRALRPLRVIRGNASMRVVVSSLMASFTDVLNVYLLSQVVSLMFAIVGVSLFSGLLLRCNNPAATGIHDCVGTFIDATTGENTTAVWRNPSYGGLNDPPFSFDDVLNAFLVVKEVQVTEGWTEVLSAAVDITAEDQQPRFNASPMNSLYFVALLTIGTFFVAQLYTGVIVASYARSDGTAFMTEQQRDWIVAKLSIVKNKPPVIGQNENEWAPRRFIQDLLIPCKHSSGETCHRTHHHVHSRAEIAVAVAVMLNMIVIMLYHYGMSQEYTAVLDNVNTGFLVLFALEMALKLFALGLKRYWTDASNAFDGSIVVGSSIIMLLSLDPTFASLSYLTQIARLFRVGRLLRLTHHFPRLKRLFETIIYALPSMGNVTALLLLVLFVGTIIGMEMFGDVPLRDEGPGISRHANFKSFWAGFLLLFRGLTGEGINVVARDCMRIHTFSPLYFMMFNDVVKSVFLNLYLATIIDKLDGAVNRKNRLFEEDFERFETVWLQYDKKAYGYIPVSLLRPFLRRLKQPLGGPEPPKEFTTWYLAVFPMIACHAKKNRVKYRDVLMALTTHAVDAKHLLVGERVHRDVLLARSEKMLAALRIQCAYRSHRTRQMFDKIRDMTKSKATMRSLRKLQEMAGLKRDPLMLTASGSNAQSAHTTTDSGSGSEVEI